MNVVLFGSRYYRSIGPGALSSGGTTPLLLTVVPPGAAALPQNESGSSVMWNATDRVYTGSVLMFDYSSPPNNTGSSFFCSTSAQLTTAVGAAVDGDNIIITSNLDTTTGWTWPNRGTPGWVHVKTDLSGNLPTYNADHYGCDVSNRITDSIVSGGTALRILRTTATNNPIFEFDQGSSGWWFTGLQFMATQSLVQQGSLINISAATQTSESHMPNRIVIDRCAAFGPNVRRIVEGGGKNLLFIGSLLTDADDNASNDSQAILMSRGGAHILMLNNEMGAISEIVHAGGTPMPINNFDPHDIVVFRNLFRKKPEWQGFSELKNMFELKHAVRVLMHGNKLRGHRIGGQNHQYAFTPTNQTDVTPWAKVWDVTIHGNYSTDASGGFLQANPQGSSDFFNSGGARLTVIDNISDTTHVGNNNARITLSANATPGLHSDWPDFVFVYNTVRGDESMVLMDSSLSNATASWERFNMSYNVNAQAADFGIVQGATGINVAALNATVGSGNWAASGNIAVTGSGKATWGTLAAAPWNCLGDSSGALFVDPAAGNFRLKGIYSGTAENGRSAGCDIDWVLSIMGNIE